MHRITTNIIKHVQTEGKKEEGIYSFYYDKEKKMIE